MQSRLKQQREQELADQKHKYEKIIDDLKKNSMNDREFVQKELQKRIEELEKQLKEARDTF